MVMLCRVFLVLLVCLNASVIFSGGCISVMQGEGNKHNRVFPERRTKVLIDVGYARGLKIFDTEGFFVVSPGGASTPTGSESRYSLSSAEVATETESSGSVPRAAVSSRVREDEYARLWLACREMFETLYECFRQVHCNFKARLHLEAKAFDCPIRKKDLEREWQQTLEEHCAVTMGGFERILESTKKSTKLLSFSQRMFFVDIGEISYVYGKNSVNLRHLTCQRCPSCKKKVQTPDLCMRMCVCGVNLIIPDNYQELENALASVHKYLFTFIPQVRQLNKELKHNS